MFRRVHRDGSYLSASDARVLFGLGAATSVDAVLVEWPDGARERWRVDGVDHGLILERGSGIPVTRQ